MHIVYTGQSDDDYHFTVTHDGVEYSPVYNGVEKAWQCACDGFDTAQGACLHTEAVKLWRQQARSGNGQASPPPPQTADHRKPPKPKAIAKDKETPADTTEQETPPAAAKGNRRKPKTPGPTSAFPTPASGVTGWTKEIAEALLAPFAPEMVGWKAQATTKDGSRAMAVAYVDARAVADRLDATVGPENWSDQYAVLGEQRTPNGQEYVVACRLTVLGVTKEDVGSGEDHKAAYSDAFKRAAVRYGVARYLYSLDKQWVAYDAQKRQLKEMPALPAWAVPA
ncbi:hypothetical protein GC175_31785 [bacterium]|nr:hypothetical protein [bacterium]